MAGQRDFLGIKELQELSPNQFRGLYKALEMLVTSDVEDQIKALNHISKVDAHRRSPLAIVVMGTRITTQDIRVRSKIVHLLADAFHLSDRLERAAPTVIGAARDFFSRVGEREIRALLELMATDEATRNPICTILNQCSTAGQMLIDILNQRDLDVSIRMAAAQVIAHVGFLDAEKPIELLEQRMMHRSTGQLTMKFASHVIEEEEQLLPVLRQALEVLREAGR